jgi:hypothetical protein
MALDQVAYAVWDLDEAVERYKRVFGPFYVVQAPSMDIIYRGQPGQVTLKLAFASRG